MPIPTMTMTLTPTDTNTTQQQHRPALIFQFLIFHPFSTVLIFHKKKHRYRHRYRRDQHRDPTSDAIILLLRPKTSGLQRTLKTKPTPTLAIPTPISAIPIPIQFIFSSSPLWTRPTNILTSARQTAIPTLALLISTIPTPIRQRHQYRSFFSIHSVQP